jgi:predicted dehydrogenase
MIVGDGKIGVAVVGLGIGEQHALAYLATEKCELRWLHDLDRSKAQALTHKLGAGNVPHDFKEVLRDPDTQAISIASYDDIHFEQVVAALNAGKHVFVEKPICRTIDELRAVKRAWSQHGGKLKLASNLVLRAAPLYRWLRQKMMAGDLGGVYAVDADYLFGRLHKITEGWRKDVDDYSVIAGGGVHLIDLILWLTNQRPAAVMATGNRICTEGTPFRYNDYVAVTLQFPSGLVGRISANFGCVHRHQHVLRVFGREATFIYDDAGSRFHTDRDPAIQAVPIILPALPASKGDLIPAFVEAIRNDENLDAETQSHLDVISIIAACDASLKTRSMTEVLYV